MSDKTKLYWVRGMTTAELVRAGIDPLSICPPEADEEHGLTQCAMTLEQAHSFIPKNTLYCYKGHGDTFSPCPFWDKIESFPRQQNGHCHFLKAGDYADLSHGLLWDMCKSCGVSEDFEQ